MKLPEKYNIYGSPDKLLRPSQLKAKQILTRHLDSKSFKLKTLSSSEIEVVERVNAAAIEVFAKYRIVATPTTKTVYLFSHDDGYGPFHDPVSGWIFMQEELYTEGERVSLYDFAVQYAHELCHRYGAGCEIISDQAPERANGLYLSSAFSGGYGFMASAWLDEGPTTYLSAEVLAAAQLLTYPSRNNEVLWAGKTDNTRNLIEVLADNMLTFLAHADNAATLFTTRFLLQGSGFSLELLSKVEMQNFLISAHLRHSARTALYFLLYEMYHQNEIKDNVIVTNGNECVDIKESAIYNLVEHNNCTNQLDPDSGAFDSRGEHNIFRNNTVGAAVSGAGVRLGGDTSSNGIQNCVIENRLMAYGSVGAIKVMTSPQKALCGNTTFNTVYGSGNFRPDVSITAPCTAALINTCLAGRTYGSGFEAVEGPGPVSPQPSVVVSAAPSVAPSRAPSPSPVTSARPSSSPIASRAPSPSPVAAGTLPVQSVSASSDDGNVAANVLDGNYDTRWSADGRGEWIMFDLGQPRRITDVAISFYRGNKRRAKFDIETSDDGSTWKRLYRGESSGKSTSMQKFNISDRTARYVRLVNQGNNENDWGSYKEVVWYGR